MLKTWWVRSALKILRKICQRLPRQLNVDQQEEETGWSKKTREHLEAEKNLKGREGEELKIARKELPKKSHENFARITEGQMQAKCLSLAYCEREGKNYERQGKIEGGAGTILWKKFQDDGMKKSEGRTR